MEWGVAYLVAALALLGLGLWAGLGMNAARIESLEKELAGQKAANEALRKHGTAAVDGMGKALEGARRRDLVSPDPAGVVGLFGGTPDPQADTPSSGASRPT